MKKFFKRVVLVFLIVGIGIAAYGYYKGITIDDAIVYVNENFLDKTNPVDPKVKDPVPSNNRGKEKHQNKSKKESRLVFEPLPINPFAAVDKRSRNSPKSVEKTLESLAKYLEKGAKNDLEKSRAIYIWLTDNIAYDDQGYNSGNYSDCAATSVLENRRSVCEGYANLFFELGKQMGLKIKKISGYSKGYSYNIGDKFTKTTHAWNMVKIDEKWGVFDATWGRGFGKNVNGKLKSTKEFDDYWFNVDPYEAIFSHLPENPSIAKVNPVMNLKTYEAIQEVSKNYFRLGFDGKSTYKKYLGKRTLSFPTCYNIDTYVKMNKAHKYEVLKVGKQYEFEFFVPRGVKMAVISSDKSWSYFDRKKGVFKISYKPNVSGELKISCKHEKGGKSFHTLMVYKVIDGRPSV